MTGAMRAQGAQSIAGLRGFQRHPVFFLVEGSHLSGREALGAVAERKNRGQQVLLRRALWPNSGIATPEGVCTGFNQRLVSTSADRTGNGRDTSVPAVCRR